MIRGSLPSSSSSSCRWDPPCHNAHYQHIISIMSIVIIFLFLSCRRTSPRLRPRSSSWGSSLHLHRYADRRGPPVHGRRDGCVPGSRRCPGIRNPLSSRPSSGRRSKGCIHIPVWKGSGHGIMPGIVENPSAAVCRCFTAMHKGPDGHGPG